MARFDLEPLQSISRSHAARLLAGLAGMGGIA